MQIAINCLVSGHGRSRRLINCFINSQMDWQFTNHRPKQLQGPIMACLRRIFSGKFMRPYFHWPRVRPHNTSNKCISSSCVITRNYSSMLDTDTPNKTHSHKTRHASMQMDTEHNDRVAWSCHLSVWLLRPAGQSILTSSGIGEVSWYLKIWSDCIRPTLWDRK